MQKYNFTSSLTVVYGQQILRYKNRLVKDAANTVPGPEHQEKKKMIRQLQYEIKQSLGDIALRKRSKLRSRLLLADPNRKKFWRFLKFQMQGTRPITGIKNTDGKMLFQHEEIEDAITDHFANIFKGQRHPVFVDIGHKDQIDLAITDIDEILNDYCDEVPSKKYEDEVCSPFSSFELAECLKSLPNEKSAGIDQIPNEFLRNCSVGFRQYLLSFLNNMIQNGNVPEKLKLGKCVLVHKVFHYKVMRCAQIFI